MVRGKHRVHCTLPDSSYSPKHKSISSKMESKNWERQPEIHQRVHIFRITPHRNHLHSLWGTSEHACPIFTIWILLWLQYRSKCASHTASAGVVLQQSDQRTAEVKAASSSCTTELSRSSSECDQKSNIFFFLWRSNPTHWILLQHNGYSSLLSTLLWQTCTDTMSQHEKVSRTASPKVKWGDLSGDQPYQRRTFVNKIKNTPFKAKLMW